MKIVSSKSLFSTSYTFCRRYPLTEHFCFLQDQRAEIFQMAEGEINRMLTENLLNDFRASSPYKELVNDEKI